MNNRLLLSLCVLMSFCGCIQAEHDTQFAALVEMSDEVLIPLVPDNENIACPNDMIKHQDVLGANFWDNYSKQQVVALIVGAAIVGYGAYKAYHAFIAWYFGQTLQLSVQDRDILLGLTEAMEQDVKQVSSDNRKPSWVKKFDLSGLSSPLDIECKYWQHNFVMLYDQCQDQQELIDVLDSFYGDFNQAIKNLISKARIV